MAQFENGLKSHEHSLTVFNEFVRYHDFLLGLQGVADMGCGNGYDLLWWAQLENTLMEPSEPFNYHCYAVDINVKQIDVSYPDNVHVIEADFETKVLPRPVDFMWSHNSFQYAINPVNTLKIWNQQLNENGMLYICVPTQRYDFNSHMSRFSGNYEYYNHTMSNLIYMLAVNGFDCNDAYFMKEAGEPWLHAAVYKTGIEPMDPRTTSWANLAALDLLNSSMVKCVNRYGKLNEDELVFKWLDQDFHFCRR